ncbi:MAG: phospholipase D-like domain-containing protein [Actinomycetaceae bacterium]|nr:phospholipase D-like domain-containing protein [Actinomycetaceae bacterium]
MAFSLQQFGKVAKIGATAFVSAQALAVGALVGIDEWRKRRSHSGPVRFPTLEPHTVEVNENALTTYMDARTLYSDMLQAIESAEKYVLFESYIWKSDRVGQKFKDALIAAAQRGVNVYIIYDSFANLVVPPSFKKFPKIPHLHVLPFPIAKLGMITLQRKYFGRDHRKVLVVDGTTGFIGGYNIGELYEDQWRDTHLRLRGPAVWELDNAFVDFWNEHCRHRHPLLQDRGARSWDTSILAALNTPHKLLFPVRGIYIDALERATERVWITSAYFIPDRQIQKAVLAAVHRGVDVRVLVPDKSNHLVADWAARSFYSELLEAGAQIWLYEDVMIHAKTMVVDGRWVTVGTANIDELSMTRNFEINLQIASDKQAQYLEEVFLRDLLNSHELTLLQWESRGLVARITEHLLRPLRLVL